MQFEQVYLHKCYDNELGYRNNIPGKAGRFFLVSKNCVNFFPHLSKIQLNDNVLLNIVSPDNNIISLCNYVFHNSKFSTSDPTEKRNEYRIYFNTDLDINNSLFKPGDIISFTKYLSENEYYFKLNHYPTERPSAHQDIIRKLMENKGNHFLTNLESVPFLRNTLEIENAEIKFSEKTFKKATMNLIDEEDNDLKLDLSDTDTDTDTEEIESQNELDDESRLVRSNTFRDLVLFAYEYKCAITGKSIEFKKLINLEAAHIQPDSHSGPNIVTNGIALSRDLHWAFDKGFFTIIKKGESYIIEVHEKAKNNEMMLNIHGIEIFKPQDNRLRIKEDSLLYHQANIFGTFKQIRSR